MNSDLVSVIISFLPFKEQIKIERVCSEWKRGLYQYCASVKTFQLTKDLVELFISAKPREPRKMDLKCYDYGFSGNNETIFNNGSYIVPKEQHHRLIIRKSIGKWFSEMFIRVERVCFSDVRLTGELVEDLFQKANNVKVLVFVGCEMIKTCAKEFVKRMKNVECIIYHQNDLNDSDLKHLTSFVKIPSLKFLYYPGADLVNLSKLKGSELRNSPYYLELEEDCNMESEDSTDHQVIIVDLEKTKQFNKSKQSLSDTLKLFGIISNEFAYLFNQTMKLPPNECIGQIEKLLNNGMHFFDVDFNEDMIMSVCSNHWRNENVLKYMENHIDYYGHAVAICLRLVELAESLDEKIEIVQRFWNEFDSLNWYDENWYILSVYNSKFNILEEIIERNAIEISLKKYTGGRYFNGLISKIKSCSKKRKELEKQESSSKKRKV